MKNLIDRVLHFFCLRGVEEIGIFEEFKRVQECRRVFLGVQECRSDASLRSVDDTSACMVLLFSPTNFSDADDADDADSFCFS